MKILAIDTTENTATAAICENERLLASFCLTRTRTHSESMLPMVDALLKQLHMTVDGIDLFAVSAGPGSFTGVRIGAATVKGLTFGREKPIVAVSALEAMAWSNLGADCLVCPCMDARRGQVYGALFSVGCDGVRYEEGFGDDCMQGSELIAAIADRYDSPRVRFCGGAWEMMTALAAENPKITVVHTPEPFRYEHAWGVALCAYKKYIADPTCAVTDVALAPTYLRASQAERERELKKIREKRE